MYFPFSSITFQPRDVGGCLGVYFHAVNAAVPMCTRHRHGRSSGHVPVVRWLCLWVVCPCLEPRLSWDNYEHYL